MCGGLGRRRKPLFPPRPPPKASGRGEEQGRVRIEPPTGTKRVAFKERETNNRRARSLLPLLNAFLQYLVADVDTLVALLDTSALPVVKLARATRRRLFREDDAFPNGIRSPGEPSTGFVAGSRPRFRYSKSTSCWNSIGPGHSVDWPGGPFLQLSHLLCAGKMPSAYRIRSKGMQLFLPMGVVIIRQRAAIPAG